MSKFLGRPEGSPGRSVQLSGRMSREFAWTFRNAPEGPDKQIDISQENTSLGVRSSALFIWRAVFAAWQRSHYFRGSTVCSLGSAFIIVAASCV